MKFLKPLLFTITVALFTTSSSIAQEKDKIATVDMKKLFNEFYLTKNAQAKVQLAQAELQKENNEKVKEIREIMPKLKALDQKIKDPVISKERRGELQLEFQRIVNRGKSLENNLRDRNEKFQKAINEDFATEVKKILEQINEKVITYARENNIDLVYDKSARAITQTKVLVFAKDKFEITSQILKILNADAPKEEAKPADKPK